jgi:diguanylate cyclase (GGDEF)-like protein
MAASNAGGPRVTGWKGDRLRGAPKPLIALLLSAELLALVLGATALATEDLSLHTWGRAGLLLGMSLIFEELSRQVGKLRLLISSGPKPDMTSVWTFAAPLALFPGQAALLAAVITGHVWLTRQRASGQYAYRKLYTAATIVLACMASSAVLHNNHWPIGSLPAGARHALTLVLALLAYTSINRLLISLAMFFAGAPRTPRALIGGWDDNALELATLCLGYFTALSIVHQPWLAPLMLMPALLLQRGALVRELEQAASTDTKTQLLTALAWEQNARQALKQAVRDGTPVAVLLIDLDRFKQLNDTHGHLVGDAALLRVGDELKREVRKGDLVGRFGGEEFVVLLPALDLEASLAVAERIRLRIADIHVSALGVSDADGDSPANRLSASIGLACFPHYDPELPTLLHAADSALYHAKRTGRNRVEVAGTPGAEGSVPAFG